MFSFKTFFAISAFAAATIAGPIPHAPHDCHSHSQPRPHSTSNSTSNAYVPTSNSTSNAHVARQAHTGRGTFFFQNGNAGACGQVHSDYDLIVALQTVDYANGANCGRTIAITDTSSGKTVNGVIADECPTCGAADNIDLSVGLFTQFADESVGVIPVTWQFV